MLSSVGIFLLDKIASAHRKIPHLRNDTKTIDALYFALFTLHELRCCERQIDNKYNLTKNRPLLKSRTLLYCSFQETPSYQKKIEK